MLRLGTGAVVSRKGKNGLDVRKMKPCCGASRRIRFFFGWLNFAPVSSPFPAQESFMHLQRNSEFSNYTFIWFF
jgi:hypothetical protein